ncbi:MAG: dihydrofolate reductase [Rhodocyclaceae bacterium]|nr:dihydrofolate reductase [Rhodocyclaceae bacterium]MBX3668184.1 dihydrofolate reductase [Rhodocyclaceae bacterium]
MPPRISLIAALAANGVIGAGNALPWKLPEDLRHFKALTSGHPVVMGGNTWRSIARALPQRTNIVVTRDPAALPAGVLAAPDLAAALALAGASAGADEVFVIGGAQIYALALPLAERLYLTEIHADIEGDTCFPAIEYAHWAEIARSPQKSANGLEFDFAVYERRSTSATEAPQTPATP